MYSPFLRIVLSEHNQMTVRMVNELRLFLPEKDILVGLEHLLRFLENYKRFLENQLNGAKTN